MITLIDSHSHFDDDSFSADREAVLARAQSVGVIRQIVPAISAGLWYRLREVCKQYSGLYPAYGLHPLYLPEHRQQHLDQLAQWIEQEQPVAVGECGLDYWVADLDKSEQERFFIAQLHLAREAHLPVIIHARRSVEDVIKQVRQIPGSYGVVHSFAGSEVQARQLIERGFYLSFGGPITYPRANKLRRLVQTLPLENILLETDSPDQPLSTHRGERNEPAYLLEVLQTVAELRQQSPVEVATMTNRNTITLFNLSL
ncbi:hydrolase, TatD family [Thioploca ingrica]|uniref:Hydrolase, TatD family n=1 Tax=Thioploca ingrica TaxID=40754 RepID=A0A090AHX1_9GAMM|nr:hydrolase, TatD family [Thioploca ingrica]